MAVSRITGKTAGRLDCHFYVAHPTSRLTVETKPLIFAPRSHMTVALNRRKMSAATHCCLGVVLPVVFGVKHPFEGERGSAQYATVISKLRRHHPKLPILPRADKFGQFVIENRN